MERKGADGRARVLCDGRPAFPPLRTLRRAFPASFSSSWGSGGGERPTAAFVGFRAARTCLMLLISRVVVAPATELKTVEGVGGTVQPGGARLDVWRHLSAVGKFEGSARATETPILGSVRVRGERGAWSRKKGERRETRAKVRDEE